MNISVLFRLGIAIIPTASLLLGALPADAAPAAAAADSTADKQEGSSASLDEIIVTAQKRKERLQDVPISISVLGGGELDKSSLVSVTDALELVPGVSATVQGQGHTQLTVRGVTAGATVFAGASPIAYYLDSVPFGLVRSAFAPDTDTYDLDRVEVLRGPQGTLYGASALNGVVRVLTNNADLNDFDFKARTAVSTTDGGGENYRGDMAVNLPIIDGILAARLVAGDESLSGYINSPVKNHINDGDLQNLRLKVNAQPTDDLSIQVSAAHSVANYGSSSEAADDGRTKSTKLTPSDSHYDAYDLKIDYQFSAFSITSASSYLTYISDSFLDLSPGGTLPLLATDLNSRVFAQEFTLNSKLNGPWRWSAGAFYRNATDNTDQTLGDVLPAPANFTDESKSAAVYGEVGRKFLQDQLELTAGLRYFHDDVSTQQNILYGEPAGTPLLYESNTFDATTPRLVLTWYVDSDLTAYGSYSEGFRSGFPQDELVALVAPEFPPVKPDKLRNYEIGAKGTTPDRRISFDAALYYMDWKDIQQELGIPVVPGSSANIVGTVNGASASGVGVDLAVSTRPVTGLELGVNFSWNDLSEDKSVYSSGQLLFAKGSRIDNSPQYTGSVFGQYTFALGAGFSGSLAASARYTSEQTTTAIATVAGGGPLVYESDSMVIGRTSFAISSPTHWVTTFYADNVGNNRDTPLRANVPSEDLRIRPRTIGIQLDYRYK
jgi:iron complex outermembrane recepter protein